MIVISTPLPACSRRVPRIASVGLPKTWDPYGHIERLRIRLLGSFANDLHVCLHRRSVGMDLHDRNLVPVLVDVFVERDQSRLAGRNELDQGRHACPLLSELSRL